MEAGTKVIVKKCKAAHPALHGATGEVLYTILKDLIVMVKFDKAVSEAPSFYGGYFHAVAVRALEAIE